ncbi:RHS repeat domain-containing protein [Flavobacterium collinsii]|uniref:RHS repeat domain-containing protein n=1 Tax=Flavobacterium collinsii TaxID=1114861 RepID=UPI002491ECB4|nr:RHS repeat-associated core domain-containing protein [Flavobacterium collinsii]
MTDNSGTIVEKRLFDVWGALLKVQNGAGTDLGTLTVLDRGYTGHEHLQSVGIINMNGRLYDPKMHRFMQPDNFIQDPSNTQNYNRYGYVLNNPLKYTDPSGEYAEIGFLAAVGIGAAIAALSYTMTALLADVPFSVGGLLKSTFIGAASAAVTFGIGTAASSIFSTPAMGFWQGAYQGAVVGSITGAGGSVVNKVFTGESITLKAILGGVVTGGIVGGAVGGIQGGLRAESLDSEFWSGKKWQEIKIGYGTKNLFSSKVNFSDTRWDIDQQMNIAQTNQNFDFDCTHACKLSVDSYYNVSGQKSNNLKWLNRANTLDANGVGGIKNVRLMGMYEGTGYSTNPLGNGYFQSYSARVSLPWMSNEMSQNRIIQIGWKPDGTLGHASLVTRLRYLSDFSRYRIDIMNPNSGGTTELRSFSKIHQIF